MARIRTIKPQFWDDEKIAKLSIPARLMFVGTWNFADDHGILLWDSTYIKSKVFPLDKYNLRQIQGFMDELIKLKFVRKYKIRRGDTYAIIPHFLDHQVINRPQSSTKPHPKWLQSDNKVDTEQQQGEDQIIRNLDTKSSLNNHGKLTDDSRQGKEGKGRERKGKDNNPPIVPPKGGRKLRYVLQNRITKEKINVRAENNVDALNQTPWDMDETLVYQRPK